MDWWRRCITSKTSSTAGCAMPLLESTVLALQSDFQQERAKQSSDRVKQWLHNTQNRKCSVNDLISRHSIVCLLPVTETDSDRSPQRYDLFFLYEDSEPGCSSISDYA